MEITSRSRLFDVLEAYPSLEEQVIKIAPPFKNLRNPVLRRTVGKLATLENVAQVGGMDVNRLVNTLRRAVSQPELSDPDSVQIKIIVPPTAEDPDWIPENPRYTINGDDLLQHGEVPLGKVNELLEAAAPGEVLLLVTSFEPSPILDAMNKQNHTIYHKLNPDKPGQHLTYIK